MNSTDKLLEYVCRVSKQRVVVDGKVLLDKPNTQIEITPDFFLLDDCAMCGRCCVNENNIWTQEGYDRIVDVLTNEDTDEASSNSFKQDITYKLYLELMSKLRFFTQNVNGKDIPFWEYPADSTAKCKRITYEGRPENLPRCHWMDMEHGDAHYCLIHLCRSVTCGMPHMRFRHIEGTRKVTIGIGQYGRNHNLGCPVKFEYAKTMDVFEKQLESRIMWLWRLRFAAEDMGIDTYLEEIISVLRRGMRNAFIVGEKPQRTLFTFL